MGEFRFRTPVEWDLPRESAATIHVVGLDGIPWPCQVRRDDDVLVISRNRDESGRTYLSYDAARFGRLMLCTGSLLANPDHSYDLLIELARGTLNRARNQISIWQEGGLTIEPCVGQTVAEATRILGAALMSDSTTDRDERAKQAIELTLAALFEVSRSFGRQVNNYRRNQAGDQALWLGCSRQVETADGVGDDQADGQSQPGRFDGLLVPPFSRLRVRPEELASLSGDLASSDRARQLIVGPFLDASAGGMSQSLIEADDFGSRRLQVLNSVRETIGNLPSETAIVQLMSGINGLGHRYLNYSQQLQLAIDMLSVAEETAPAIAKMVSFDFPWAERLAAAVGGIHPLHVADSFLRQGAQLSYIGLEMNLDYGVTGSAFRDPLQWIELVDVWAQLGVPLVLCLRTPTQVDRSVFEGAANRLVAVPGNGMSDDQRIEMLQTVLPMMAARPSVAGILWQQWSDADDERFPFAGLVDAAGEPKPALSFFQTLKQSL